MTENTEIVCQKEMHDGTLCRRPLAKGFGGNECLFHLPFNYQVPTERFQQELENYIKQVETDPSKSYYDFTGFNFRVASFNLEEFRKSVIFNKASFESKANFSGTIFKEKADFRESEFLGEANFFDSGFREEADFTAAKFHAQANLSKVQFLGDACFLRATFNDIALLNGSEFTSKADFTRAEFRHNVDSFMTWFEGETDFSEARFLGDVDFSRSKFQGVTNFSQTDFLKKADFSFAEIGGVLSFLKANIFGKLLFKNNNFEPLNLLDFREVLIGREGEVQFFAVDLSKALFLHTDLSRIDFINVNWEKEKTTLFGGREKLYDEKLTVDANARGAFNSIATEKYKCDKPGLEHLYRQLKKKYDEKAHYRVAGDFHKGEMEVIRIRTRESKLLSFDRADLIVSTIYKYLSYYGENYIYTVRWLLLTILLLPIGFMFTGLDPNEEYKKREQPFKYYIACKETVPIAEVLHDYSGSLLFTLRIFSFQREGVFHPKDRYGDYLVIGTRISSVTLLAFFLLAIRRRFKR